jgi:hypothetical protein
MRVRIINASDKAYWYAHNIGDVYNVKFLDATSGEYIVRASDGYINIIKQQDCEIVREND